MHEFSILKSCKVNIKPPRAPIIKEVIWPPSTISWIKINIDGAFVKYPNRALTGGIFRNHEGICVGCFAQFLGEGNALFAELSSIMAAIEIAASKNYLNVWVECD